MHELLQKIEDSPKPVVMAMHGTALGGGLEVAMAGHYRVAVPDAQMGQPEVNLGIIPGAEGTQRLPRLVGLEKAIEMCVSGKPIKAADALSAGLIDRIIEGDLATGASGFAREMAARKGAHAKDARATGQASTRKRHPRHARSRSRACAQDATPPRSSRGGSRRARSCGHAAVRRRVRTRARTSSFELAKSEQAKALIHAFFAERGVSKVPGVSKDTVAAPVNRVGIIGAGTMGGGIAMACANAGISVRLTDTSQEALDSRHRHDSQELRRLRETRTLHPGDGRRTNDANLARRSATTDLATSI